MTPHQEITTAPVPAPTHPRQTDWQVGWRPFVRAFALLFAMVLLGIAVTNFLVNPIGLYSTRLLPQVTWNTREIKPALLQKAEPKPQALVLGSSRSMKISPEDVEELTGLPAFNAAVDAGLAEDWYVMLRYAVERAGAPLKLVIVGVDVEGFHDHLPVDEKLLYSEALRGFLPSSDVAGWKRFYKLFTVQQVRLSIRSLRAAARGEVKLRQTFEPNGYLHYVEMEAERATGRYDLESKVTKHVSDYVARFAGYDAISAERRSYFEQTLAYCRARNIRVVLFVTPLHDRVAAALEARGYPQRKREVLAMVRELGQEYGASVYDFSDVRNFDGAPAGFYDGAHIDEPNNALATAVMLSDAVQ